MSSGTQQEASDGSLPGFEGHIERGAKLIKYLAMSDDQAQIALMNHRGIQLPSPFHEQQDLDANGWHLRSTSQPISGALWFSYYPIRDMLQKLHPTTWSQGSWKAVYKHAVHPRLACTASGQC